MFHHLIYVQFMNLIFLIYLFFHVYQPLLHPLLKFINKYIRHGAFPIANSKYLSYALTYSLYTQNLIIKYNAFNISSFIDYIIFAFYNYSVNGLI